MPLSTSIAKVLDNRPLAISAAALVDGGRPGRPVESCDIGYVQNEYMNNKGVLDIDQWFVGCHIDIQQ